jgi:predicted patatin/cPLA2 family phospholipase
VDNRLLNALSFVDKATLDAIKNLKNTDRFKDLKKLIEKSTGLTEIFSIEPSKILEITVKARSKNAIEKIYCIIDFKETDEKPCTVYKYKE